MRFAFPIVALVAVACGVLAADPAPGTPGGYPGVPPTTLPPVGTPPAKAPPPKKTAGETFPEYVATRQTITLKQRDGSLFNLTLPKFIAGNDDHYPRTFQDTCGQFAFVLGTKGPPGTGPPPHIHYAEHEWFIPLGEGQTRIYSEQPQSHRIYIPGELPGFNMPAGEMGSVLIEKGDAVFSPKGNLHWYTRETNTTNFLAIHIPGRNGPMLVDAALTGGMTSEQLLYFTGLYGVPHDETGQFTTLGRDFQKARGDVLLEDRWPFEELQAMFDRAEQAQCIPVAV